LCSQERARLAGMRFDGRSHRLCWPLAVGAKPVSQCERVCVHAPSAATGGRKRSEISSAAKRDCCGPCLAAVATGSLKLASLSIFSLSRLRWLSQRALMLLNYRPLVLAAFTQPTSGWSARSLARWAAAVSVPHSIGLTTRTICIRARHRLPDTISLPALLLTYRACCWATWRSPLACCWRNM